MVVGDSARRRRDQVSEERDPSTKTVPVFRPGHVVGDRAAKGGPVGDERVELAVLPGGVHVGRQIFQKRGVVRTAQNDPSVDRLGVDDDDARRKPR